MIAKKKPIINEELKKLKIIPNNRKVRESFVYLSIK